MTSLGVARVIGASASVNTGNITIKVELADGSLAQIEMPAPAAQALVTTLHQTVLKLADRMRSGPLQQAGGMVQVQMLDCETVQMGHDVPTKTAVLLLDHGKPSEVSYRLPEKQFWELAQGLNNTMQVLFGRSPDKRH